MTDIQIIVVTKTKRIGCVQGTHDKWLRLIRKTDSVSRKKKTEKTTRTCLQVYVADTENE